MNYDVIEFAKCELDKYLKILGVTACIKLGLASEFGVSLAMVTLGPKGCLLKTSNSVYRGIGPKVTAIDTTGAGDIFGGSALFRLLELDKPISHLTNDDLAYSGRFAVTAASLSTELAGGIPSIPNLETVLKKMHI